MREEKKVQSICTDNKCSKHNIYILKSCVCACGHLILKYVVYKQPLESLGLKATYHPFIFTSWKWILRIVCTQSIFITVLCHPACDLSHIWDAFYNTFSAAVSTAINHNIMYYGIGSHPCMLQFCKWATYITTPPCLTLVISSLLSPPRSLWYVN